MRNFVNKKTKALQPSGIRRFFDIVQETEGAISLGVGEPDFVTPWSVRAAAITLSTLPILIVYPQLQKYFVSGIVVGSVKG